MGELNSTGFTKKTLQQWLDQMKSSLTDKFGAGFVTGDDNPAMKLVSVFAAALAESDEAQEAVYNSQYPATATGSSLDLAAELTGHFRRGATFSTVIGYGWASTQMTVTAGSQVSVAQTGALFAVLADTTIINNPTAGATKQSATQIIETTPGTYKVSTAAAHGLAEGDFICLPDSSITQYAHVQEITNIVGATEAEFQLPTTGLATDSSPGDLYYCTAINFQAIEQGEAEALAQALINIETPITGWVGIENYVDATEGTDTETDSEFRARRDSTLSQLSGGTFEAIKSTLENTTGVSSANLFTNETGVPDYSVLVGGLPLPPYSVTAFVNGGTNQDVAQALFGSVSAGVPTFGDTTVAITDSEGNDHDISFARLTEVEIYVSMSLVKNTDPNEGPVFGSEAGTEATIRDAVKDYIDSLDPGNDVLILPNIAAAIGTAEGFRIDILVAGDNPSPTETSFVSIDATEIAVITNTATQIDIQYV